MIESMRERGPEEGPPLSYLPSMSQDGASASAGYENHGQEIEYLRKEAETRKKELKSMQQGLESVKNVTKQLEEAYNSLKKMYVIMKKRRQLLIVHAGSTRVFRVSKASCHSSSIRARSKGTILSPIRRFLAHDVPGLRLPSR